MTGCKHFTVVELLSVIIILCITVTLLLPAVSSGQQRAKLTVCANNLRTIGQSVIFYCSDNTGARPNILPGLENSSIPIVRLPGSQAVALGRLLNGYLTQASVFGCPGSPGCEEDTVEKNWQNQMLMVWSAYLYRGGCADFAMQLHAPANHNKPYVIDFACINGQIEQFAPHNYQFSNLLFTDCHVESRRNVPEPFKLYTLQASRHGEITPDCTEMWLQADK